MPPTMIAPDAPPFTWLVVNPCGMRVVPVQTGRFVARDLNLVLEGRIGGLDQRVDDVVLVADRGDIEAMEMQIGGILELWCRHCMKYPRETLTSSLGPFSLDPCALGVSHAGASPRED